MATFVREGTTCTSSLMGPRTNSRQRILIQTSANVCRVVILLLGYVSIQVYGLNDGKPVGGGFYPFPPPPPPPSPVIPGGKSWKGGFGYPSVYPSTGSNFFPQPKPSIFPPFPTGGKSWGGGGGGGPNIIHVPYPVMVPTGSGFGGHGGGGGHQKGGLLSGLKSKLKSKFSGVKGMMGGGIGIPMIYMPYIGHGGFGGGGGGSSIGIGGKFGGKFNKFGGKGGASKYPFGTFGGSFGDLGVPQSGKSIGGGGGGGWYPPGGSVGTLYPTNNPGPSCYDSTQCGMRSCCAMTPYGPKCLPITGQTISRCIDAMPLQRPQILPPQPQPQPPSIQILPPQPPQTIQVLPQRPQNIPTIEILPPGPTIHILPQRPPPTTGGITGGKSWRPPVVQPESNCRPGFCPRYSTNEGPSGPFCQEDGDCPYPRKCCAVPGSKSYGSRRTCLMPSYS